MSRFDRRSMDLEIMDDLQCSGEVVHQTLRELETINRLLGGNDVTLAGIRALLKKEKSSTEITIADWGCGGGDMLKRIADWGRKEGLNLKLIGIDANPHIIAFAIDNCRDYPEIGFEALNIFSDDFRTPEFDIVVATLFIHHFTEDELVNLFRSAGRQVRIGLIVNDIHRHWLAYHSIRLLTRIFSKSAMVKFDAPLSVLRAFKRAELKAVLSKSGIRNFIIQWRWAFRWQVLVFQPVDHSPSGNRN